MADKMVKIGAAWKHESTKGNKYFSGQIKVEKDTPAGTVIPFVIFKNTYKQEGDKKPDLVIYEDDREKKPKVDEEVF